MTAIWIVAGLALAAAALFLTFRARADHAADMGAVSHQWISEHRLGTSQDPRR
jgi:hypothetical protein